MGCKLVLVSAVKWSPLLAAFLVNAVLFTFIQEEYPKSIGYHRKPHPKLGLLRLEGRNMASIDMQVSNLTNRSVCVDYRTFNWTDLHGDLPHVPLTNPLEGHSRIIKTKKTLSAQDILDVQKFVLFVGYPRSGHSIVGSMMDAHPNMVIAHEYNLFRQWEKSPLKHSQRTHLYNALYKNSVESAKSGWRSERMAGKGYTLGVDHQWQASFTELKVIGDKSGAITTQLFEKDPERFVEILGQLKRVAGVPIRVIHVVRNPYDMISTRLLYADGEKKTKLPATEERKHCDDYGISYHTNRTFHLVSSASCLLERTNLTVLDVHHVDLVRNPRRTISMICRFLNLPYPEDYLNACEKKAYSAPSKTRLLVSWPEKMVERVQSLARPYSFLWRYSFEVD